MKKLLLATAASALIASTAYAENINVGVILGYTGPIESLTATWAHLPTSHLPKLMLLACFWVALRSPQSTVTRLVSTLLRPLLLLKNRSLLTTLPPSWALTVPV